MTLLYTLTVGTLLWWFASGTVDTRFTMGIGGPWVYGGVLAFVLGVAVRGVNRRRAVGPARDVNRPLAAATARDAAPTPRFPRLRSLLHSLRDALLVAAPLVLVLAAAFDMLHVGDGGFVVVFVALYLAVPVLPVALVVGAIGRRWCAACAEPLPTPPPDCTGGDVAAALAPLLVPLAAMILLRNVSAGAWWELRVDGPPRAGFLYLALLPLMLPAAVLVAWGLDRLDGSRGGGAARACALLALAALTLAVWALPRYLLGWNGGRPLTFSHGSFDGYGSGLNYWHPFLTSIPDDPPGSGTAPLLPLTGFFRASAAMLLLAAALATHALARLGRGVRTLSGPRVAAMLALQVLATVPTMPRFGPVAAPLAAVVALLAALGAAAVPVRLAAQRATLAAPD